MKKLFLILFLLIFSQMHFAQIRPMDGGLGNGLGNSLTAKQIDSLNEQVTVKLSGKTHYTDYKKITIDYDTIVIDTTLTIKKEYKFNSRRKDNFELLEFHNQGHTFNTLVHDFSDFSLFPDIGFQAKHFNYYKIKDVYYYEVPTPTSEIMARTGLQQGQIVDAFFTGNFSRRLNASIAFRGLRSLGHYRSSLSSSRNFRTALSYRTPKNQYAIRMHFAKQGFTNEENGGLPSISMNYFKIDDENFSDRARLDVNLEGTETTLKGTRVYIDHNYKLFSSQDSTNTKNFSNLKIGHEFTYEKKEYLFGQKATNNFFGTTNATSANDLTTNKFINNQGYLEFNSKYILGRFKAKANYTTNSYGYDNLLNKTNPVDKLNLNGKSASLGADWKGRIGDFFVNADATVIPGNGHLSGNYFKGEAFFKKDSLFTLKAHLSQVSKKPNYNFQLFQSAYNSYNWSNNFSKVATQNLGGSFSSRWINASVDFTNVVNYAYFDTNNKPKQYNHLLTYFKIKGEKEFTCGKFSLANTILYQEVTSGASVFRVPKLVTRNTFYYTDEWFKAKSMLVNIGLTFKYFTKYKMAAYNPLLAEFTLQNDTKIGYPTLDLFFNGRVKRARLFLKVDNVTSYWTKKNYFSAPNYPYRDFTLRFGVVWNWFI